MNEKLICTERLDLRPSKSERDLLNYISHLKEEDGFYLQYGYSYSEDLEAGISFDPGSVIYYSMFLRDTDVMVGYIGILPSGNGDGSGDLEFYTFREYRRNHYGYEAATVFMKSFIDGELTGEEMSTITATTLLDNEPCIRFLEKLGFTRAASGCRISLEEEVENRAAPILLYEKHYR